jgi:hypothetical protein
MHFQFFKPLSDWLKKTNAENGDLPGWDFFEDKNDDNEENKIDLRR